jgi:hypothetical protein
VRGLVKGLEITVIRGAAVLAGAVLAHGFASRHRCSCLLVGLALGFIPELREIQLPSETVLLLFHSIQPE